MPLNDGAGDQRVTVESTCEREHAHSVIDRELQRLHPVAHFRMLLLPAYWVWVVGETTQPGERMIDVTAIGGLQCGVIGSDCGNTHFLGAPVEVTSDRVG